MKRKPKMMPRKVQLPHGKHLDGRQKEMLYLDAIRLWKALGIHKHGFYSDESMDEKTLSRKTWMGCYDSTYDSNPDYYNRFNDQVINFWHAFVDDGTTVMKLNGTDQTGQRVTKICKVDKDLAIKKTIKRIQQAGGLLVAAEADNVRHDLGQQVGEALAKKIAASGQERGLSTDQIQALTAKTALSAGKILGGRMAAQNLLDMLDDRESLKKVDAENEDPYSEEAKDRRRSYIKRRKKEDEILAEVEIRGDNHGL